MVSEHIKVIGHRGTWYVIAEITKYGKKYYLLEHETYGDEAAAICIREDGTVLLDDIWNGLDDVWDYLEQNPLLFQ
jgi:hypothetical protein